MVKARIHNAAFKYLTSLQATHSKSKNIVYTELTMQGYLKPGCKLSINEKAFTFAARTSMLDVKSNFELGKTDLLCRKCSTEDETQKHIMVCSALSDNSVIKTLWQSLN